MPEWIPIDPTLTTDGAFAALSALPQGANMKPVPWDSSLTPFGIFYDDGQTYDLSVAAQLGVGSVADVATTFKTRTYAHDTVVYTPVIATQPSGGQIWGTWWGAGIRIRVDVISTSAKANLNLGMIAAEATLGLAEAWYTVEGLGICDVSLLKLLPGPGKYDLDTYQQLMKAKAEVISKFLTPKTKLDMVPFRIWVLDPGVSFGNAMDRARAQVFAIRRIRDGVEQGKAVAAASRAGMDPVLVEAVYTKWAKTTASAPKPSDAARSRADQWLEKASI